jgi:Domain of unknown function (DUF4190)
MSGEPRGAAGWPEPPGPRRTSGTATLALGAGVLSFVCLFGLGGVLAIALGWIAHSEIERSSGRIGGKGLASAGIGLGIANLVLTVVGVGVLFAFALRSDPAPRAMAPALPPPALPTPAAPPAPPAAPSAVVAEEGAALPPLPSRVGKIVVVEANGGLALEAQLRAQLAESKSAGEQVVLWTVTAECEPCDAVGRALPDARMQRALGNVRLVRADAASFPVELRRLGVPIDAVPGFTLLDSEARAQDHIHGGEWDADIPANIAPVLDKFVKHAFASRRHPWSRPLRDGETTL